MGAISQLTFGLSRLNPVYTGTIGDCSVTGDLTFASGKGILTGVAADDYFTLMAYDSTGAARCEAMRVANNTTANAKIGFFGTTPAAQQAHIADASGDDATAVNAIIDALKAYGLLAPDP